jgi:hypothetical protein
MIAIVLLVSLISCSQEPEKPVQRPGLNQLECTITSVEYRVGGAFSPDITVIKYVDGQKAFRGIYAGAIPTGMKVIIYYNKNHDIDSIIPVKK